MKTITLEQLIEEGSEIKKQISYINVPAGVIRTYRAYQLSDNQKYETWKNMTIRFLSVNFPGDRCINDFEKTSEEFSKSYKSPIVFDKMLGILNSCLIIPQVPIASKEGNLIQTLDKQSVEDYKKDGTIAGGMIPKVDSCIDAIHNGVNKAHIIDGRVEHSILLELFTSDGIGTQFIRKDNPNNGIDMEKLLND